MRANVISKSGSARDEEELRDEEEPQDEDGDKTSEVINNELSEDDRGDTAVTNSSSASSSKRKNVKKKKSKAVAGFQDMQNNYSGSLLPSRVKKQDNILHSHYKIDFSIVCFTNL